MSERKMATIRKVSKIIPIPDAEFIEVAEVDGWRVVVKKGEFQEGDLAVYCEIDSFIPNEIAPFLTSSEGTPKEYQGIKGERLKTKKLRGVISQGLLLPMCIIPENPFVRINFWNEGDDVSEILGIVKYDPPLPAQLAGQAKGNFPSLVPKTDEERVQNLAKYWKEYTNSDLTWEVTEKLEGCFLANQYIETWIGESVKIKDIVNKGERPLLIGVDADGNVVPCEITNVFKNGKKDNWIRISFDTISKAGIVGKSGSIVVTPNHKIFTKDMLEVEAAALCVGDSLIMQYEAYCDKAMHYMRSSLLGDGSVGCKGHFSYNESHASKYRGYLDYIKMIFSNVETSSREQTSGKGSLITHFKVFSSPQIKVLREEWYPNGKKILPKDISWIDDFTVAKWYMDDGSLSHSDKQNDRAVFSTNAFCKEDVERLADKLISLYGVDCTVYEDKGWNIRVNYTKGTINRMWESISKHIEPSMRYKLPEEYRNNDFVSYGQVAPKKREKCYVKITNIHRIEPTKKNFPSGRTGYDIETTTHNYFCGGILVHNSSCTFYLDREGNFEVCSRNISLKEEDTNSFWKAAKIYDVEQKMRDNNLQGFAIQGELIGEGIQGNIYNIKDVDFYVYKIWSTISSEYLKPKEQYSLCKTLGLKYVPVIYEDKNILECHSIEEVLNWAEDKSRLNSKQEREGIVFKCNENPSLHFKVISNKYLLKQKD